MILPHHSLWLSHALIQNSPGSLWALTFSTTQSKLTFFSIHPFTSLIFCTLPHLNPKTCFSKALVSDVQKAQWCLMLVTFPSKKAFLHTVSLFDTHNNPFFLVGYEFDTHNQSILIDWTFSSLLQMRKLRVMGIKWIKLGQKTNKGEVCFEKLKCVLCF